MAPALIAFDFDPVLHLGDLVVRWETLALAATIMLSISLAALIAGRVPAVDGTDPEGGSQGGPWHLRRDDLLLILLGVIPGAVIAGRIGYVLIHGDYYSAHPEHVFDLGQGALELSFAVIGGTAAGIAVAAVVGAPVGRWLHAAIVPLLIGLGLGKLAMVLGGDGQGIPSDLSWATAYTGQGPWGSLASAAPSHPAQVYEGLLTLLVAVLIAGLLLIGRSRHLDGRLFYAGLSLWALARLGAAFVWRDSEALGPFRAAQIVAVLIAFTGIGLFVWLATGSGRGVKGVVAARARLGSLGVVVPGGRTGLRELSAAGVGALEAAPGSGGVSRSRSQSAVGMGSAGLVSASRAYDRAPVAGSAAGAAGVADPTGDGGADVALATEVERALATAAESEREAAVAADRMAAAEAAAVATVVVADRMAAAEAAAVAAVVAESERDAAVTADRVAAAEAAAVAAVAERERSAAMEPGLWLPSAADSGAAGAESRQAGVLDAETDRAAAVLAQEERGRLIAADAEHALIPRADGEGERTSGAERVAASVDRERLLGATIEQRLSALASEELQAVELEETGALESSAFPVSALALAAAAPDPFGRPHVEPAPTPAPTPAPARTARPAVPVEPWYRAFLRELETRQPPGQGPAQARRTEDEALTAAAQRKADAPRGAESSERDSAQVAVAAHATEAQTPHSGEVDREKDVSRAAQVELTIANERAATEAQAREVERLIEAELIAIGGLMPEAERLASDERDARERGAADRN